MSRRHSKKSREEKKRIEKELAERDASPEEAECEGSVKELPAAAAPGPDQPEIPGTEGSCEASSKASSEDSQKADSSVLPGGTNASAEDAEKRREDALSAEKNAGNEKDKKNGEPEEPQAPEKRQEEADASKERANEKNAAEGADPQKDEPLTEKKPDEAADEAQLSSRKEAQPRKSSRLLRWVCLLLAFVVLILALGAFAWMKVEDILYREPAAMTAERIEITVPQGASATEALNLARKAGITLEPWKVRVLRRFEPSLLSRIHVGRFRFERGMTPEAVLKTLSGPALIDQQLRIPEGAPVWDVLDIISEAPGLEPDSARMTEAELLQAVGLEGRASLEGYLAPETYRYGSGSSDLAVLRMAVDRQKRLLDEAWNSRNAGCQAKNPYELLILASIIEKETGVRSDRHLVSSVFNNRLRIGMALQTDPTVIYGLGPDWSGRLRRRDLETPTPWNTYRFAGLPPTPISMPSAASIEAAAHPAETKYLYFVARGDGTSEFSTNLRDHNRAVNHFIIRKRTTPLPQK
ncbi:endolytic transglycosylase MltG [uncultured Sutterella sp.]|uniref:endolytic transglycosylase MltG n=1 Tax=uncultured Sutterella sp. TaxID=286133 RepID=UPI002605BF87|nr:endolytic transglycosylase MltG [uncultured Sutterella sp.]